MDLSLLSVDYSKAPPEGTGHNGGGIQGETKVLFYKENTDFARVEKKVFSNGNPWVERWVNLIHTGHLWVLDVFICHWAKAYASTVHTALVYIVQTECCSPVWGQLCAKSRSDHTRAQSRPYTTDNRSQACFGICMRGLDWGKYNLFSINWHRR